MPECCVAGLGKKGTANESRCGFQQRRRGRLWAAYETMTESRAIKVRQLHRRDRVHSALWGGPRNHWHLTVCLVLLIKGGPAREPGAPRASGATLTPQRQPCGSPRHLKWAPSPGVSSAQPRSSQPATSGARHDVPGCLSPAFGRLYRAVLCRRHHMSLAQPQTATLFQTTLGLLGSIPIVRAPSVQHVSDTSALKHTGRHTGPAGWEHALSGTLDDVLHLPDSQACA